jgi:hypothetical protein
MHEPTRALPARWIALLMALFLALAMVACGDEEGDDAEEPAAQETEAPEEETEAPEEETPMEEAMEELTVTATEFSFDFPATLPAGHTMITLHNKGKQTHHLIMAKLTDDAPPIDKLIKMRNADKYLEEDLTGNKPPLAKPGETAPQTIDAELTSGTYAYVCFMPDKETEKPHALLGMYGSFEVE